MGIARVQMSREFLEDRLGIPTDSLLISIVKESQQSWATVLISTPDLPAGVTVDVIPKLLVHTDETGWKTVEWEWDWPAQVKPLLKVEEEKHEGSDLPEMPEGSQ